MIPGVEKSSGVGNGNPLQYSCLENSMDRGTRRVTAHGVAKSRTRLSNNTFQKKYIKFSRFQQSHSGKDQEGALATPGMTEVKDGEYAQHTTLAQSSKC